MCGGGPRYPEPLTAAELAADTNNRFENPISGVSAPSWKPDEVKKEKAEIAAEEAAAKASAQLRTDAAETIPRRSGGMGAVARNIRSKRLRGKSGQTRAQKAATARRN